MGELLKGNHVAPELTNLLEYPTRSELRLRFFKEVRMKNVKSLVCGLLVFGLISAAFPSVLGGAESAGPKTFKLRLAKLTVLDQEAGGIAEQTTIPGVVTVYGLTAGVINKAGKLTYPTFVAKKSQTKEVKFCLDFKCTATTTLYWTAIGSGPMVVGMSDENGIPAVKNTTYRAEFIFEQAHVDYMAIGTYDIIVVLGPKVYADQLTGSGGMTMATIRIRFDN